jgi:hypothetical protein
MADIRIQGTGAGLPERIEDPEPDVTLDEVLAMQAEEFGEAREMHRRVGARRHEQTLRCRREEIAEMRAAAEDRRSSAILRGALGGSLEVLKMGCQIGAAAVAEAAAGATGTAGATGGAAGAGAAGGAGAGGTGSLAEDPAFWLNLGGGATGVVGAFVPAMDSYAAGADEHQIAARERGNEATEAGQGEQRAQEGERGAVAARRSLVDAVGRAHELSDRGVMIALSRDA